MHPRWIAPIVTWLASAQSAGVTGRVFEASGRLFAVAEGWHRGPTAAPVDDPTKIGPLVDELMRTAPARTPAWTARTSTEARVQAAVGVGVAGGWRNARRGVALAQVQNSGSPAPATDIGGGSPLDPLGHSLQL